MSEIEKIKGVLAKSGRSAYLKAKADDKAYVLSGNRLCTVKKDGTKEVIAMYPQTKVKVSQHIYTIK